MFKLPNDLTDPLYNMMCVEVQRLILPNDNPMKKVFIFILSACEIVIKSPEIYFVSFNLCACMLHMYYDDILHKNPPNGCSLFKLMLHTLVSAFVKTHKENKLYIEE